MSTLSLYYLDQIQPELLLRKSSHEGRPELRSDVETEYKQGTDK